MNAKGKILFSDGSIDCTLSSICAVSICDANSLDQSNSSFFVRKKDEDNIFGLHSLIVFRKLLLAAATLSCYFPNSYVRIGFGWVETKSFTPEPLKNFFKRRRNCGVLREANKIFIKFAFSFAL